MKIFIETERLLMREFTADDAPGSLRSTPTSRKHMLWRNLYVHVPVDQSKDNAQFANREFALPLP
ncbi:MAG: hypothetical protein R2791_11190 [Saprospiraceae bacterium]|nr:hypothetical protein [Saprospiraceae bacterium]